MGTLDLIKEYDVIGLVETWCNKAGDFTIEGYSSFEKVKTRRGLGDAFRVEFLYLSEIILALNM